MMDNGGILTDEEIEALLRVSEDVYDQDESRETLTESQRKALEEICNISFGASSAAMMRLLNREVKMKEPIVSVIHRSELNKELPPKHIRLKVAFTKGLSGDTHLIFEGGDASIISGLMLGGEGSDPSEGLSEIEISAMQEITNQMMGILITGLSKVLDKQIAISPPVAKYLDMDSMSVVHDDLDRDLFAKVVFQLHVSELISSTMIHLIPMDTAKILADHMLNNKKGTEVRAPQMKQGNHPISIALNKAEENIGKKDAPQFLGSTSDKYSNIHSASFSDLDKVETAEKGNRNLDMLMDIPLNVTVELGRTKKRVENILELTAGSILELDKLAGEPVDVLVNQKLIAKGEVIVIDENFGVRVTDIISQKDRIMRLY